MKKQSKSRLEQVVQWLGKDFTGCVVFDECHKVRVFPRHATPRHFPPHTHARALGVACPGQHRVRRPPCARPVHVADAGSVSRAALPCSARRTVSFSFSFSAPCAMSKHE